MSKENFINGSILEFKLPHSFGYAYCKVLDFRSIREFDGILVKVYNHIVTEPIKDIKILSNEDWLFGARRMPWLPSTRGKGAWRFKGVLVSEDDAIIPDFKYSITYNPFEEDKSKLGPWHVIRNINQRSKETYSYDRVMHLEDTVLSPRPAIERRAAMEYCRIYGIDLKKYFDFNDDANKIVYAQMISIPIYSTIPKKNRGKALN
jgi:hypothetical protein